jgi:hypothetical protein
MTSRVLSEKNTTRLPQPVLLQKKFSKKKNTTIGKVHSRACLVFTNCVTGIEKNTWFKKAQTNRIPTKPSSVPLHAYNGKQYRGKIVLSPKFCWAEWASSYTSKFQHQKIATHFGKMISIVMTVQRCWFVKTCFCKLLHLLSHRSANVPVCKLQKEIREHIEFYYIIFMVLI